MAETHDPATPREESHAPKAPDRPRIAAPSPAPSLTLTVEAARRVNAASAQNDVAVLHALTLANEGDAALSDLTISMHAEPPLLRAKTWQLDRIAAGGTRTLSSLRTEFDTARLSALNEAEVGALVFTVDGPDGRIAEVRHEIEFLARDEWGGVRDMAQLLAAFVSPNDPVVAELLREASELLERAGYAAALDGYQSGDPQRAWLAAGAIWSAATARGLHYAHPPASFEKEGQKVRGPGRIKAEGLATCLDTSLLLAAAFEAAGLNPVVLFTEGHALVGVWLVARDFGYVTEPDVVAVRKAVQAREFVPIETTLLTHRPAAGLEQAVDHGRRRLGEEREHEFVMAVDIARARSARIRPLASPATAAPETPEHDEAAPATLAPPARLRCPARRCRGRGAGDAARADRALAAQAPRPVAAQPPPQLQGHQADRAGADARHGGAGRRVGTGQALQDLRACARTIRSARAMSRWTSGGPSSSKPPNTPTPAARSRSRSPKAT